MRPPGNRSRGVGMLISGLWNAGVARRRGRGGNTAVGVQEKGGRRWREVCVFPGTRASKPAWPVANRWQARSPVGHKQLGDALFPPRAKFRESHSGLGDPASLWPPGPPSERGGVPLQDARCDAGLRMDLPLASSKAGGLGSPRSRNLPVDNHSSPRRRGAATGRPTGDRGQGTGDRHASFKIHHSKFGGAVAAADRRPREKSHDRPPILLDGEP